MSECRPAPQARSSSLSGGFALVRLETSSTSRLETFAFGANMISPTRGSKKPRHQSFLRTAVDGEDLVPKIAPEIALKTVIGRFDPDHGTSVFDPLSMMPGFQR